MGQNLGPLNIKDSYQGLVQISGSQLTDGTGSLISSVDASASFATTASYASNGGVTSIIAGSNITIDQGTGDVTISSTGGGAADTGSLLTTASISDAQITFTKGDASTFDITVNNVVTANTASYVAAGNIDGTVANATSASHADNASTADSATTATTATTASYVAGANVDGTVASATTATTASYVAAANVDGTVANATSASYAVTASYAENAAQADAFPFSGSAAILGTLDVNVSGATDAYTLTSASFSGSVVDNITDTYTTTAKIKHVTTLTQAEYNAISASADANTLYYITDAVEPLTTASLSNGDVTFTKQDGTTFVLDVAGLIAGAGSNSLISRGTTTEAIADGAGSIAIGDNAQVTGSTSENTIVIGKDADSKENSDRNIVIGYNAAMTENNRADSVVIGASATAYQESVVVGANTTGLFGSVAVGRYAYNNDNYGVAIGYGARTNNASGIALGTGSLQDGNNSIAIGAGSHATAEGDVVIYNGVKNVIDYDKSSDLHTFATKVGVSGSFSVTGSTTLADTTLGDTTYSGSVVGEVSALSISSQTASLDCSTGNFFTLTLVSGSDTHLDPSNIKAGQTINLKLSQPTTATDSHGTISFESSFEFVDGTAFEPTAVSGSVDVMTFISFDGSTLQATGLKNFS